MVYGNGNCEGTRTTEAKLNSIEKRVKRLEIEDRLSCGTFILLSAFNLAVLAVNLWVLFRH